MIKTDLCKRSKTIGGTASIRNNVHVWPVCLLVHPHHKHWCISRGSWYYHFLGTTLQKQIKKQALLLNLDFTCQWFRGKLMVNTNLLVCWSLIKCSENPGRFNYILSPHNHPKESLLGPCKEISLTVSLKFSHKNKSSDKGSYYHLTHPEWVQLQDNTFCLKLWFVSHWFPRSTHPKPWWIPCKLHE